MPSVSDNKARSNPKTAFKTIDDFFTINSQKMRSPKFWFVIMLIYISFLNFLALKTTPEAIFLQYFVLIIVFLRFRAHDFIHSWLPFIGLFLLYEFLRGFADDISPFKDITLFWVNNFEITLFGKLPTKILQDAFAQNFVLVNTSLFFYTLFFYYSFFVGFVFWLKAPDKFGEYFKRFLLVSFAGLLLFFFIPTAPPWYVDAIEELGIERLIYNGWIMRQFSSLSLYQYFIYGNAVAALPSLHSAWPMFTSLYLIKTLKTKLRFLFLVIPLMIGFSVVLAAEHYVIDVVVAFLLAYIVFKINLIPKKPLKKFS